MSIQDILIEKLRFQCLKRGVSSIKSLSKMWSEIDQDQSNELTFEQFRLGLNNLNIDMNPKDLFQLFKLFDAKDLGHIDYLEFVAKLRVCFIFNTFLTQILNLISINK